MYIKGAPLCGFTFIMITFVILIADLGTTESRVVQSRNSDGLHHSLLIIHNAQAQDEGNYTCMASNIANNVTMHYILILAGKYITIYIILLAFLQIYKQIYITEKIVCVSRTCGLQSLLTMLYTGAFNDLSAQG